MSREILAYRLLTLHNLYYYLKLMVRIRQAVAEDRFAAFRRDFYENIKIATREVIQVVNLAYAQGAGAAPRPASMMSFVVPMIFMVVIFYFLLIRPQQKKAKEHKALLDNLKKGDRIITSGGIIGTIVKIDDQIVNLEIADKVRIEMGRPYIAGFAPKKIG